MVDLNKPHPTGVGKPSLSLARNILSVEQIIGDEDRISKKADSINASNLHKDGNRMWGGTVAQRKDISLDAQHVNNL